jgi:flagellar M-ring protein FliF
MGGNLLKLRTWWETADRTTKTVTLVGGGLLIALLLGVFYFSSSPDMKQLFAGLPPTEQGRVVQKLQELKVPYKQEPDGSIFVPAAQIAEMRARLAQDGIPSGAAAGNLWLDKSSFSDTEQIQNEKVRIALEEEMQKTIQAISAVGSAKVHIAPGSDSPFANEQSEPSASVLVELRPGAASSRNVADVIVRLMAGAVKGLKPSNISVSDSNGIVLWNGESDEGGSGVATKKREAELAESERITRALDAMIVRTVGPGKAVVSANVEMNFDKETLVTEGSPDPVSEETMTEKMTPGSGRPIIGGPATLGGTPAAPGAAGAAGAPEYTRDHKVINHDVVRKHSEKSVAPGAIKSARISIMLDESAKSAQKQITDFASNLIGATKDPDNFSVAVTTTAFDKSAADKAAKELAAAKGGQTMQQVISLLPVLALIVVGFLVMKSIGKAAGNNRNVLAAVGGIQPLAVRGAASPGYAVTSHGVASDQAMQPLPPEEIQLSDAAKARRDAIRRTMRPDVDDIPEKFDVNLEQILKMADQRPESVALLLKSWLLEEVS